MTATAVALWRPTPGQLTAFLGNVAQAKALHERHGLSVNVWNAVYAGVNSMTVGYVTSADDLASFTARSEAAAADPDWLAFWAAALNTQPASATLVSNSLATTLPEVASDTIGKNTTGTPRVVESFAWGPMNPAQRAALVELIGVLTPRLHEAGSKISTRMAMAGGPAGPGITMTILSPSMTAWGARRQETATDAALVAAVQKAAAVTGPPMNVSLLSELLI